jgi:pilus assembly protein CpaC
MFSAASRRALLGTLLAASATLATAAPLHRPTAPFRPAPAADAAPLPAATTAVMPARQQSMSIGGGQLMRLPRPAASVFVADEKIADVQVKNPTTFYLFAKTAGMTSVYATDHAGAVIWSTDVRVGANIADVAGMLAQALPESDIKVTPLSGMILLTGTVLGPKDSEEAQRLAEQFTANNVPVLNHLQIATPQQVMLQVKIAEVSRNLARTIGVNFLNRAQGNPLFFGAQGTPGSISTNTSTTIDKASGVRPNGTISTFTQLAGTTLGIAGRVFGADIISSLQLYENSGQVHTLAEPTLTALSGETASFLAGGEIPIPQSQGLGAVSVEFKEYGVSLSFSPLVMSGGRIMLRVRPEVSQLSSAGAVTLNGFSISALTTRRAETTVELGSGQSFMIGGLIQNDHNNQVQKAPFLGNLPVLGALFRSTTFQKNESELVIVVTPYLVKGVDAKKIALPTDGYRAPTLAERVFLDKTNDGLTGGKRPVPTPAPTVRP